jgi:asparagine synthase (glutamine-hydrolysing)
LGTRTFFEQIQLLPGATVLIFDLASGEMKLNPYWSFDQIPFRPEITFHESVEEAGRLLRQAVRRLSGDDLRPGLLLSGGLDSRILAGLIDKRPLATMTYGHKNSRDVYYAKRIARVVGSDHHWFDFPNGKWVLDYVNQHLEVTEGLHSWIHMHGIHMLEDARQLMDVNLTGWDGGTVMGHPDDIVPTLISPVNDETLMVHMFNHFIQKYTWPSITEAEENGIYNESLRPQMVGLAQDSFRTEFCPYLDFRQDIKANLFYIRNHCMRLTHNMITMYRSSIEVRFPFFDPELFDFLYSIPAILRAERKFYFGVLDREVPQLSGIPYDHDEFLPTNQKVRRNLHALGIKVKRRVNKLIPIIFPERATLYADYEGYLRNDLRTWGEDVLFDRRTAERGLFNIPFLKALYERHMHGNEEWTIGKIAPFMTYEMFLRRYVD